MENNFIDLRLLCDLKVRHAINKVTIRVPMEYEQQKHLWKAFKNKIIIKLTKTTIYGLIDYGIF